MSNSMFGNVVMVLGFCVCMVASAEHNLLKNTDLMQMDKGTPHYWERCVNGGSSATTLLLANKTQLQIKKIKDGASTVAGWVQKVPVKPNTTYRIAGTVTGKGRLFCYELDADGQYIGQTNGVSADSTEAKRITCVFQTSPKTVQCLFRFELWGKDMVGEGCLQEAFMGLEKAAGK